MTDDEILELAETFGITPNKYKVCIIWKEDLLKFARELCDYSYDKGYYNSCIDMGDKNV